MILATLLAAAALVNTFDGIRYSEASTNCVLDLSVPAGKGYATLVWLHGGGLYSGRRHHLSGLDTNRIASVAVEYRLTPEHSYTNCVEDAAAAVAWVLDNIALYGGDPKKVFVGGHSAGGWLTYMIGYDPRWLAKHKHSIHDLAGLIPLSGQATTHFHVRALRGDGEPRYAPKIDEWAPLAYVRGGLPPTCIVTGERGLDIKGRVEENELLATSLKACGTRLVEFHERKGTDHGSCMKNLAPIVQDFMARTEHPTFHNSLGAPNGEAPCFVYDKASRYYYGVFSGEKKLTLWRARHVADILSSNDRVTFAAEGVTAPLRTPKLVRQANGKWRVYASVRGACRSATGIRNEEDLITAESKTKDPFDGFGPFVKLGWNVVDPAFYTAADGKMYMAAVEVENLVIREMSSQTNVVGAATVIAKGLEGPAFVTAPNGRLFLAATEHGMRNAKACVRLLAFVGGEMTDAKNWKLLEAPLVLGGNGVYGPGFASFFASPDGRETWCAFHAMGAPSSKDPPPEKLYARIQKVAFDKDGVPSLGVAAGDKQQLNCPSGE